MPDRLAVALAANDNKQMPSALSHAQLDILRRALDPNTESVDDGDRDDFAILVRAGLLRDLGGGRHVPTEAGRRYGRSVFGPEPGE